MIRLLKFGNVIFGIVVILMLVNSVKFYFTNVFYEHITIEHKIIFFVLALLIFLTYCLISRNKTLENIAILKHIKAFVFCLMLLWQCLLLVSMPIVPIADPGTIYRIAIGETGAELLNYISVNPNNYMLLIWEKCLLYLFGKRYLIHGLILFNIAFIDIAILLLDNLRKRLLPNSSNLLFYLLVVFVGFSPQFLQAYTDSPAFFFGTLIFYVGYQFVTAKSYTIKLLLSIALGIILGLSYGLRASLLIYAISGVIVLVYQFLQIKNHSFAKNFALAGLTILSFMTINSLSQFTLHQEYVVPFEEGKSRTMFYFVDLGLTSTGAAHAELSEEVVNAAGPERNQIFIQSIKQRVAKMDLSDWKHHLDKKLYYITAEGLMGWQVENVLLEENMIPNRFSNTGIAQKLRRLILVNFSDFYPYSVVFQILWIVIILGMVIYSIFFPDFKNSLNLWVQITIFGGILFLMIFEGGRSRYLIQFLPAVLWNSSIGYERVLRTIKNVKKQNRRI
ncbi:hypothetical protein ACTGZM_00350 [Streptococcus suis]